MVREYLNKGKKKNSGMSLWLINLQVKTMDHFLTYIILHLFQKSEDRVIFPSGEIYFFQKLST